MAGDNLGVTAINPDYEEAVQQYEKTIHTADLQLVELHDLLATLKDMTADKAFLIATAVVLPKAAGVRGSGIAKMASTIKIARVLTQLTNSISKDLATITKDATGGSAEAAIAMGHICDALHFLHDIAFACPTWMDKDTASAVISGVDKFFGLFGLTSGQPLNGHQHVQIAQIISFWSAHPELQWPPTPSSHIPPNVKIPLPVDGATSVEPKSGTELLQKLLGSVDATGGAFTSSSAVTQSVLQNEVGIEGQIFGAIKSMLQSILNALKAANDKMGAK